ncbi:unnamed protein product [Malus baccata var. baccata]
MPSYREILFRFLKELNDSQKETQLDFWTHESYRPNKSTININDSNSNYFKVSKQVDPRVKPKGHTCSKSPRLCCTRVRFKIFHK